jgi:hypothetical protein
MRTVRYYTWAVSNKDGVCYVTLTLPTRGRRQRQGVPMLTSTPDARMRHA